MKIRCISFYVLLFICLFVSGLFAKNSSAQSLVNTTISGYCFADTNANGRMESSEKGVSGIEITVRRPFQEGSLATVTTNSDGYYTVSDLGLGIFVVEAGTGSSYNVTGWNPVLRWLGFFIQNGTVSFALSAVELPPPAVEASINANPQTIQAGQSTTLEWSTQNAETVSINNGVGTVEAAGSLEVTPSQTVTYTITASASGTTITDSVTVTVEEDEAPPPDDEDEGDEEGTDEPDSTTTTTISTPSGGSGSNGDDGGDGDDEITPPPAPPTTTSIPPGGTLKWHIQTPPAQRLTQPTGYGTSESEVIYVAQSQWFNSNEGILANTDNGTEQWKYDYDLYFFTAPAVDSSGTVYTNGVYYDNNTYKQGLFCFNADGSMAWAIQGNLVFNGAPEIGPSGNIYVCGVWSDGNMEQYTVGLFAFNENGNKVWEIEGIDSYYASPKTDLYGNIYIAGRWDTEEALQEGMFAFDSEGDMLWMVEGEFEP